jgi:FkbM family methyltransferase
MGDDDVDFEHSARRRKQSWHGVKPLVKRSLALPGVHAVMRGAAGLLGDQIRRERLPAPARLTHITAEMAGVGFVMLRPDRCIVAKELYWGKGRRPRPEDQLALDVFAALARDARLVLDVGAYTGVFSLLAARVAPAAEVHAFEVVPDVAAAARENVAANELADRVTVHAAGLGRDGESVRIATGSGGSALPDFYSTKLKFTDGVDVQIHSLDTVTGSLSAPPPAVVKIDVEGTEDTVLRHGQAFLRSHRPDILCEVLPAVADTAAVTDALAPHGYRYLRVEQQALVRHPTLAPDPAYRDWVFTTRDDAELTALGVPVSYAVDGAAGSATP